MSIRHRLASIVNRELEKMERGEIDQLSTQHKDMLHQLLQFPRRQYRHPSDQQGSRQQGTRQRGGQHGSRQQRKPRPHCTYDRCEKPVGHWESTCLQQHVLLQARRLPMSDGFLAPIVSAVRAGLALLPAPVLASSLAGALLTATLLVARVAILPARKLQQLM